MSQPETDPPPPPPPLPSQDLQRSQIPQIRRIDKLVSGGQTGADRGALLAGIDLGLPIGGWMPCGARAEDGKIPETIAQFLHETASSGYEARTGMNVRDGDGTLILSFEETLRSGSLRTQRIASEMGKPCLHLPLLQGEGTPFRDGQIDAWIRWLAAHEIRVLNVAGPRESREPGLQQRARTAVAILIGAARDAIRNSKAIHEDR